MKENNEKSRNEQEQDKPKLNLRKGRSNKLVEKRNECLLARYYYYGNFTEKRYDVIMQQLSEEFFLSVVTIQDLVQDNVKFLYDMKDMHPRLAYFETKWQHLVW